MTVEVLHAGAVPGLAASLRQAVQTLDPKLPVYWMESLQDRVDESTASDRFYLILLGSFAALALILASVGLYGVVAYLVSRRTREIGIRVAMGASAGRVARLILSRGMVLVAVGVVAGFGAALGTGRLMEDFLFQTTATDPATFAGVGLFFALVALVACAIPAWRALRVDPMVAFRTEPRSWSTTPTRSLARTT